MKKQKLWIGILFCSFFIWTGNAFAVGSVTQRQVRQQQRIEQGVKKGNITRSELKQLKKEQLKISKNIKTAKRDRHITRHEARHIDHLQNRAGHNIYRYKHNKAQQPQIARHIQKRQQNHIAKRSNQNCRVTQHIASSINLSHAQPRLSLAWNIDLN